MRNLGRLCLALAFFSASLQAGTLTVTTTTDEENCRNESGCATASNSGGTNFPNSTGCSLREALDDILDAGNAVSQRFPECGTADPGPAADPIVPGVFTNTIVMAAQTDVNSQVSDPGKDLNDSGNSVCAALSPPCPIQYGELPHVGNVTTYGNLQITGGSLTCTDSNMLHVNPAGSLELDGVSFNTCVHDGNGLAVFDQDDADLTMNGVTFTGILSSADSIGGCIQHGTGNLLITGGAFTGCVMDNGTPFDPTHPHGGGTGGLGAAISIGSVGTKKHVVISGVAFTGNIASLNGGAIYMSGTDAVAIDTSTFEGNFAFGDSSQNPDVGGGAIYAQSTAMGNVTADPVAGIFASDFLLIQDNFAGNFAFQGNGGAVLLTNGNLTYGSAALSLGLPGTTLVGQVLGGVVASNFSANQALGVASPTDSRMGSGGAIYAEASQLAILDSSFVGGNSSVNASGGAVAYMDAAGDSPALAISNTTFNGNSAAVNGGAIANLKNVFTSNAGQVTLINDTLSGNTTTASAGGGNLFNGSSTATNVKVSNTIFDAGGTGGNCGGQPLTDVVGNLQFNPNTGCGTMTAGDPELGGATLFGGVNALVFVMKLGATSAASKHGDPATCAGSPIDNLDEGVSGRPQPVATNCDIGAYESSETTPVRLQSFEVD
jgi:predicted outer membrane repeat protein